MEAQFINVYLTDEDETGLSTIEDADNGDIIGELLRVVSTGVGFSIKPGKDDDFCAMFFWEHNAGKSRRSLAVSAFANAPRDAIVGLLYKFVYRLADGEVIPDNPQSGKRRIR